MLTITNQQMANMASGRGRKPVQILRVTSFMLTTLCTFFLLRRAMRVLLLTMVLHCNLSTMSAYASPEDSLKTEYYRFRPQQLLLPASLITIGSIGINNKWMCDVKYNLKDKMDQWRGGKRCSIDNGLQYVPIAAYLGIDFLGLKAKHNLLQRIASSATSYTIMITAEQCIKRHVKEGRPNSPLAFTSFPSGHTATAFTGAELLRIEYGGGIGIAAYTFATGVAFMRIFNDRHWLNDVLTGAGIGILSAKIGQWLLPAETRLFRLDKAKRNMSVTPTYSPADNHFGMAMSVDF